MIFNSYSDTMNVVSHVGSIWCYRLFKNGCFRNIKCFPLAKDKHGNPDPKHAIVLKYVKEHS